MTLLLALHLFVATASGQQVVTDPEDKRRLLAFKASFQNGAAALPSWKEETDPCEDWSAIYCTSSGRVTEM